MPQFLNGNYIDLVIIAFLIYFASNAFRYGFWILIADFISFLGSLIISLRTYHYLSDFLKINFNLTSSISNALGFLLSAIIIESILGNLLGLLLHKLPEKLVKHKLNKLLGLIPAIGEGLVLISFFLTFLMSLPVKPQVKIDIENSKIGSFILLKTSIVESKLNEVFGSVINDSLTYLTIKPESTESVALEINKYELSVDESAESALFMKVNSERKKLAIAELVWDSNLVPVARAHAKDMWERKYFSHYSPEGKDVGDRLNDAKINFMYAGENLALAPTTQSAHTGLMNSKGHRENILDENFNKIGIGVIDNGVYGKMFVQVFSN